MKRILVLAFALTMLSSVAMAADVYVESRDTGQNFASYAEAGGWANASSKSTAGGLTGVGCRYATTLYAGRSATFTIPASAAAGAYRVYITHGNQSNRRTKCKVDIVHNSGTATIDYDQTQNTNAWVDLGVYALTPGTSSAMLYYDPNSYESGSMIADAVRFEGPIAETPTPTLSPTPIPTKTPGIGDIFVESRADGQNYGSYVELAGFADAPSKSTAEGLTATGSRYYTMSFPNKQARFYLPTPQVPGKYDVYVTYPAGPVKGRWWVNSVAGRVGGVTESLDQTVNANTWVSVGQYNMLPGFSYVEVGTTGADTGQSGNFYSDAVKFVGPQATDTPLPPTPTASSGIYGAEWSSYE